MLHSSRAETMPNGSRSMFKKNKYERPENLYFDFLQSRVRNFTASLTWGNFISTAENGARTEKFSFSAITAKHTLLFRRSIFIVCFLLAPLQISLNLFIF